MKAKIRGFMSWEGEDEYFLHILKEDSKKVFFMETPWPRFPKTHVTYPIPLETIKKLIATERLLLL